MINMSDKLPTDRPVIRVSRLIGAPRDRVFAAFGDSAHIGTWWGPNGFTTTTERMQFRVGGDWLYMMHGPDGTDYPNYVVYREIEPPARIVYDHGMAPGEPFLFTSTITLESEGDGTRVTLSLLFGDFATRDATALKYGAVEGGEQNLARLAAYLGG